MLTFFTLFDVRMIQISTFPVAPSTERVPSLAERVASLRYSINLRILNNRVPALVSKDLVYVLFKRVLSFLCVGNCCQRFSLFGCGIVANSEFE